jgi:hypothetical protein
MKAKHAVRGLVWTAIGVAVYAYSEATNTPIVVRGTHISWGLLVIGTGVVLLVVDLIRKRKEL